MQMCVCVCVTLLCVPLFVMHLSSCATPFQRLLRAEALSGVKKTKDLGNEREPRMLRGSRNCCCCGWHSYARYIRKWHTQRAIDREREGESSERRAFVEAIRMRNSLAAGTSFLLLFFVLLLPIFQLFFSYFSLFCCFALLLFNISARLTVWLFIPLQAAFST